MSEEYRLETVSDFLKLEEDAFVRMTTDFLLFYFMYKNMVKKHPEAEGNIPAFIWVDDGKNDFLGLVADENNN